MSTISQYDNAQDSVQQADASRDGHALGVIMYSPDPNPNTTLGPIRRVKSPRANKGHIQVYITLFLRDSRLV